MYKLFFVTILFYILSSCNNSPESQKADIPDTPGKLSIDTAAKAEYDERFLPDTTGISKDSAALLVFKMQLRSHINYISGEVSKVKEDSLYTTERKNTYKKLRSTLVSVYNLLNTSINKDMITMVRSNTQSLAAIIKILEEKNDELKTYASNIEKIGNTLKFLADAASNLIGMRTVPVAAAATTQ